MCTLNIPEYRPYFFHLFNFFQSETLHWLIWKRTNVYSSFSRPLNVHIINIRLPYSHITYLRLFYKKKSWHVRQIFPIRLRETEPFEMWPKSRSTSDLIYSPTLSRTGSTFPSTFFHRCIHHFGNGRKSDIDRWLCFFTRQRAGYPTPVIFIYIFSCSTLILNHFQTNNGFEILTTYKYWFIVWFR